ncbi:MAG: hypothetical protein EOL86_12150 [Deltaproteobacteria bacterium]|nr:hypothetical protein [Pseudomonadota bacterium]NCD26326.1 hypothetical protein [Deltaproteobacteria bacterium]
MSGLYSFSLALAMVVLDFKNPDCRHFGEIQATELVAGKRLVVRPENEAVRVQQIGGEFTVPVSVKGVASGVGLFEHGEGGCCPHLLQPEADSGCHRNAEFLDYFFVIIEDFFISPVAEEYVHTCVLGDLFNQFG